MEMEELLEQFGKHWSGLERAGKVSGFDRLEWMAIEIFARWLKERYRVDRVEKSKQHVS